MEKIFKLLEELDQSFHLCHSIELYSDKSGQIRYGGEDIDPFEDAHFDSLEEAEDILKGLIPKKQFNTKGLETLDKLANEMLKAIEDLKK